MKTCSKCNCKKLPSAFYKRKDSKDGRQGQCKDCLKKYNQQPRIKEWKRNYQRRYQRVHKYTAYRDSDAYRQVRKRSRLKKYNLTLKDYDVLFEKQNGVCAICKQPETATFKDIICRLSVDHCHKTNKVRGLLCKHCNTILGYADDNIQLLKYAINYLRRQDNG